MEVYKICKQQYSTALNASGIENRWNKKGQFVIYTSNSRSLAALELIAHRASIMPAKVYKSMVISFKENTIEEIKTASLPKDWQWLDGYPKLQEIGSLWYEEQRSLVLKVPSAIIQKEHNYVINTRHPSFKKEVTLLENENFFWDIRLL
jgi:RES domain-containing protein